MSSVIRHSSELRTEKIDEAWFEDGPNRVCSPDGYCIKIRGLIGVEYQEGDLILRPNSEALWGSAGFGLSAKSIAGTPERRHEIIGRIRAGLDFMGWKLQVDEDV